MIGRPLAERRAALARSVLVAVLPPPLASRLIVRPTFLTSAGVADDAAPS